MAALHSRSVLRIKRTALLVHHNAVLAQRVKATAVKLTRKQPFRRPERVGGIHNNQIVFFLAAADKFQRVAEINMHAAVIHAAGIAGQIGTAGFHHLRVHLHQVNAAHTVVARQLAHNAAVARADNQNIFNALMHRHRHMGNHLIVNKFVPFSQHHAAVKGQHAPKLRRFKNVYALVIALFGI